MDAGNVKNIICCSFVRHGDENICSLESNDGKRLQAHSKVIYLSQWSRVDSRDDYIASIGLGRNSVQNAQLHFGLRVSVKFQLIGARGSGSINHNPFQSWTLPQLILYRPEQ